MDPDERKAVARAAFAEARDAFSAQDYLAALRGFERAHRLVPSADLTFNIARCHEELGRPARAVQLYRRYLQQRVDAPDRDAVLARVDRLVAEARLDGGGPAPDRGQVVLHLGGEAIAPLIDGEPVDGAAGGTTLQLPAGRHDLELRAPGAPPQRAMVDVYPGGLTRVFAQPVTRADGPPRGGSHAVSWWLGGLAVGSAAAGAGLLVAESDADPGAARGYGEARRLAFGAALLSSLAALTAYLLEAEREPLGWGGSATSQSHTF